MSYSTPIDDLISQDMSELHNSSQQIQSPQNINPNAINSMNDDLQNQLVDEILNKLDQSDINSAAHNYNTDGSTHIPPPNILDNTQNLLKAENTNNIIDLNNKIQNERFKQKETFLEKYQTEIISLISFIILFFVFSLYQVNRLIFKFLPNLLLENGVVSIYGLIIKTIIATLIYSLILFFLKF